MAVLFFLCNGTGRVWLRIPGFRESSISSRTIVKSPESAEQNFRFLLSAILSWSDVRGPILRISLNALV
ncbi:hypothetical protein YC2023_051452 [Brassica napus]